MQLIYLGPRNSIEIPGHGAHQKGSVKEYPDEVAEALLTTSNRQKWKAAEPSPQPVSEARLKPNKLKLVTGGKKKKRGEAP